MSVLVTGGDGFVGQHLLADLLGRGEEVVATSPSGHPRPPRPGTDPGAALSWRALDVRDREGLSSLFHDVGPERVFHLAGISSTAEARARPGEALEVNATGTLNLLEAAAEAGTGPIVVPGSADAYGGRGDGAIDESTPLAPRSAYAATKAAQEAVALGIGAERGLDVRIARLFPLVGPGQREAFVLPSFCRRAARIAAGESPPRLRVGNLDVERDFTDVRDGVRALVALAGLDAAPDAVYNVCSGRGVAVRRLLEWVLEEAGIEPEIVVDPTLVRPGEPDSVIGDPRRLARATGWSAERDLRSSVRDAYRRVRASLEAGQGG